MINHGRRRSLWIDSRKLWVDAVEQHSERAYHQIQDWQGNSLDPELFGFKMVGDLLEPISMNKEPAKPFIRSMKVKKCECKKGCRTRICGCFADEIPCTNKCNVQKCVRTRRSVIMRLMYGMIIMDTRESSESTDEEEYEFKFN